MILIDFTSWLGELNNNILPNTRERMLKSDYQLLLDNFDFKILKINETTNFCIADLFYVNKEQLAVSSVKGLNSKTNVINEFISINDYEIIDYTEASDEGLFFYGSSSLVSHLSSEIALCGVNRFSDENLFEEYCEDFELTPISFDLLDNLMTSDVAIFIKDLLVICLDYIDDKKVKKGLIKLLKQNNISILNVSKEQVKNGILNVQYVGGKLFVIKDCFNLFSEKQKEILSKFEIIKLSYLSNFKIRLRDVII